jgi:ATP-dependent Clp protease protease subunit
MSDYSDEFNASARAKGPTNLVVPTIIEEGPQGRISYDIYSRLLKDRIIKLDGPINDQTASLITTQLLILDQNSDEDIKLYINSPGGSVTAGMAIYDTMKSLKNDVITVGMGMCASMGSFLLAAGTKGKRYALPNTRIMTHQPSAGTQGQVSDMERHMDEFKRTKEKMRAYYEHFLNVSSDDFEKIYDRDTFFNALAAKEMGHIDHLVLKGPEMHEKMTEDEKKLLALETRVMEEENNSYPLIKGIIDNLKSNQGAKKAAKPAP